MSEERTNMLGAGCISTVEEGRSWQTLLKVFDALSCHAILLDRKGMVRTANRTFLETVGLSCGETADMPLEILEPHLPGFQEQLAELRGHSSRTFHARLTDKRGKVFIAELTLIWLDGHDDIILCVGRSLHKLSNCQEAALRR
ncbi:PAS domain-containing protein, partial [Desulfobulbus sp. F4]|nr:PAS domain-containing protein [Desulfobulbus sp. F4]